MVVLNNVIVQLISIMHYLENITVYAIGQLEFTGDEPKQEWVLHREASLSCSLEAEPVRGLGWRWRPVI